MEVGVKLWANIALVLFQHIHEYFGISQILETVTNEDVADKGLKGA